MYPKLQIFVDVRYVLPRIKIDLQVKDTNPCLLQNVCLPTSFTSEGTQQEMVGQHSLLFLFKGS